MMDSTSKSFELFPQIEPYEEGTIKLDDIHTMFYEVSGNPKGVPVVFLHGGPGGGSAPMHRRFFDPDHYRIIVFDQRGARRSTPFAEVRNNTTQHLVDDMEVLRKHLGVDKWLLFGGSWGSSLALAYGIHHPDRALGFILRGVFLCRQEELDWYYNKATKVYPEAKRNLLEALPEEERTDFLHAYHDRLMNDDPAVHLPAARAWNRFEDSMSYLYPKTSLEQVSAPTASGGSHALAIARIEVHYFVNRFFLEDNFFLDNIGRVNHLPCIIVQGRYDMVCAYNTAYELSQAWPDSELIAVPDAGHSATEPGIRSALVAATEDFKSLR